MEAVFSGFAVIWLIIVVGFFIGKLGLLSPDSRVVLSRVAFFVASPCLLFTTVSQASFREVIGPQMAVAALGAFSTLLLFMLVSILVFKKRTASERLMGGLSASLVNSANLGFPIAAYVLGDVALAAPVIMFQLALYTPLYVASLDQLTRNQGTSATGRQSPPKVRPNAKTSTLRSLGQSAVNPMVIGALLGLLFSWQQWRLPGPVQESVELMAGASIPLMLLAFGLSLVGTRPLDRTSGRRGEVLMASCFKLGLHPVLAYLFASLVFGLEGHQLLAAVVMGGLPSAQNVLVTAIRYGTGEIVARDTVLTTTIVAIPSMILIAMLLA